MRKAINAAASGSGMSTSVVRFQMLKTTEPGSCGFERRDEAARNVEAGLRSCELRWKVYKAMPAPPHAPTSKPLMEKSRLGLSLLYTLTKLLAHSIVVMLRGSLLRMSQNTARPRFTSCFMSRMRASRGQHFLLL